MTKIFSNIALIVLLLTTFATNASFEYGSYDYYDNDDFYVGASEAIKLGTDLININIAQPLRWLDTNIPYCYDIVTSLTNCMPNICKENINGLLHIREVKGYDNNYCVFEEKFMYQGELTCRFKPEDYTEEIGIIDRAANGAEFTMPPNLRQKVERFYSKVCKPKVDNKYLNALFIAKDSYDFELNKVHSLFIDEPNVNAEKKLVPEALTRNRNLAESKFWFNNSISYSDEEYELLLQVAQTLRSNNPGDISQLAQNVLKEIKSGELKITSMIYLNPERWTVWLNNTKFSNAQNTRKLEIKKIYNEGVTISWDIENLARFSQNWRDNFRGFGNNTFISNDGRILLTQTDETKYNLEFELKLGEVLKLSTLTIQPELVK